LFQGNVVDFLDIRFFRFFIFDDIHGNYVFNFADISILSGVFILIFLILRMKSKRTEKSLVPQLVEDREDIT